MKILNELIIQPKQNKVHLKLHLMSTAESLIPRETREMIYSSYFIDHSDSAWSDTILTFMGILDRRLNG